MSTKDPVLLAFTSIGTGATLGSAAITGGLIVFTSVSSLRDDPASDRAFLFLLGTMIVSFTLSIATTWVLTRSIENAWRRGISSALAMTAAIVLSVFTAPIDNLGGRTALLAYFLLLLTAAGLLLASARRAAA
ncbi:MAG: hypothetical protein V3R24_04595 [Gemmatimonadales bacterium]